VSLVATAPAALAHAELATMTPADKSTVPAPTEIVATFTENLDPSGSNLVLVDAGGKVVAQGGTVDATDKKKLTLDLSSTSLVSGTYTIRWTSKSADDGDLDRNTTSFTVFAASPSPSVAASIAASLSAEPSASAAPSVEASPSPSGGSGAPASSTSDAVIPIVVVLVVLALLGLWLLRGRSGRPG
jgi:copper resistance protein C